jgi:hypothetical protein
MVSKVHDDSIDTRTQCSKQFLSGKIGSVESISEVFFVFFQEHDLIISKLEIELETVKGLDALLGVLKVVDLTLSV